MAAAGGTVSTRGEVKRVGGEREKKGEKRKKVSCRILKKLRRFEKTFRNCGYDKSFK
jgi:hypothetical protein